MRKPASTWSDTTRSSVSLASLSTLGHSLIKMTSTSRDDDEVMIREKGKGKYTKAIEGLVQGLRVSKDVV